MITDVSILTSKGQTTIPKKVRDVLGLEIGDRIVYIIENGEVRMQAARQQVEALFGAFAEVEGEDAEETSPSQERRPEERAS